VAKCGSPVRENAMAPQCPSIFASEPAIRIASSALGRLFRVARNNIAAFSIRSWRGGLGFNDAATGAVLTASGRSGVGVDSGAVAARSAYSNEG
jgi:hypothetical protein